MANGNSDYLKQYLGLGEFTRGDSLRGETNRRFGPFHRNRTGVGAQEPTEGSNYVGEGFGEALSSTSTDFSKTEDILGRILREKMENRGLANQLAYVGGAASGLGARVGGFAKAFKDVTKKQRISPEDILNLSVQMGGGPTSLFPIDAPVDISNKLKMQTVLKGGKLFGFIPNQKYREAEKLLKLLRLI